MNRFHRWILSLFGVSLFVLGPWVHSAMAAPALTSISPTSIVNSANTTVLVAGAEFEPGAVVVLNGFSALSTTFVNAGLLSATVPADIPGSAGGLLYGVQVINPSAPGSPIINPAVTLTVFSTEPLVPTPSNTPLPTETPRPTDFVRPIITVQSYGASSPEIVPGSNIDFEMTVDNRGQLAATNIVLTFETGDLIPRATGGVRAIGGLNPGQATRFFQPFSVSSGVSGVATLKVLASYTDVYGTTYSETFTLTFAVQRPSSGVGPTATPTPSPTPGQFAQLVIESYTTDVEKLQSGSAFVLNLTVHNVGGANARNVSMVVGGGDVQTNPSGTPGPGGVSGGGGEFTNFAPINASNVQVLGDIAAGREVVGQQPLVVNVSTNPGAYPLKISFIYTDAEGRRVVEDQIITLLVYSLPQIDISFYRDPNPIFAGQPASLPLQVINLGRRAVVLGNMTVTTAGGMVEQNIALVGALDAAGYFTFDPTLFPDQPGPLEIEVTVNYNDDFNQPQILTRTLSIEVMEAFFPEPGDGGGLDNGGGFEPTPTEEAWWQRLWRFILGLFGLDSGRPEDPNPPMQELPPPGIYYEEEIRP